MSDTTTKTSAPAKDTTPLAKCLCGCGQTVSNRKAFYRPGHDARHVSVLVADLRKADERGIIDVKGDGYKSAFETLPSEALKEKFGNAVHNSNEKMQAKVDRQDAKIRRQTNGKDPSESVTYTKTDDVTIGRWTYPARIATTRAGSQTERNEKRDGTGGWVPYEG